MAPARCRHTILLLLTFVLGCSKDEPTKPKPPVPPPPPAPRTSGILFVDGVDQGIYVMDADGTDLLKLSDGSSTAQPAWSPDGNRIAFSRFYPDPSGGVGDWEIAVMDYDGTKFTRLTTVVGEDEHPRWSPDGSRIAFMHSVRAINLYAVCVMNANGTNRVQLTPNGKADFLPQWSPDGAQIAFWSFSDSGTVGLYTMDSSGGSRQLLLEGVSSLVFQHPASWSPDGSRIAFTSAETGDWELYAVNSDGTNRIRLTSSSGTDWDPVWSPDGTAIAFLSTRAGTGEIWKINADGTNPLRLTTSNTPGSPAQQLPGDPDWR